MPIKKPVRNEQAETGIYVFTDAKSCYAIKIEFKLSTDYPNQHQMCWVYGVEAVFGRLATYEATGAVIQEDYSGGEQRTGYAVVSHHGKSEYNLKNSL